MSSFEKFSQKFWFKLINEWDSDIYKYSIILIVAIYHYFYDGWESSFISNIYQDDKYGIVIVFGIILALRYRDFVTNLKIKKFEEEQSVENNRPTMFSVKVKNRVEVIKLPTNVDWRMKHIDWQMKKGYFLLVCLQILAFNLIFKNNTSDVTSHRITHGIFVLLFILFSIPSQLLYCKSRGKGINLYKILLGCVFGVIFLWCGYNVASLPKDGLSMYLFKIDVKTLKTLLNIITAISESLCIVMTV
jgi:hypothetical protein